MLREIWVGLCVAVLIGSGLVPAATAFHGNPSSDHCQGEAPAKTSCDLGTQRWYQDLYAGFHRGQSYTGVLEINWTWGIGPKAWTKTYHCPFNNGHWEGCIERPGPAPPEGVEFAQTCKSYDRDPFVSDGRLVEGGDGLWMCWLYTGEQHHVVEDPVRETVECLGEEGVSNASQCASRGADEVWWRLPYYEGSVLGPIVADLTPTAPTRS